MSRVLKMLGVAGWILLVTSAIDGVAFSSAAQWVFTFGREESPPGIIGAIGWLIALLLVGVVLPLSRTAWWRRETVRWWQVAELVVLGPPTSAAQVDEIYELPVRRRLGALLMSVGLLFLCSELLEARVHACIYGKLNELQLQCFCGLLTLETVTSLSLIAFGAATTSLWDRPVLRVWCSRILVALCLSTLFSELAEREMIHRTLIVARDVGVYRQSVAAIWISAIASVVFMMIGWGFAERGRPIPSDRN